MEAELRRLRHRGGAELGGMATGSGTSSPGGPGCRCFYPEHRQRAALQTQVRLVVGVFAPRTANEQHFKLKFAWLSVFSPRGPPTSGTSSSSSPGCRCFRPEDRQRAALEAQVRLVVGVFAPSTDNERQAKLRARPPAPRGVGRDDELLALRVMGWRKRLSPGVVAKRARF